MKAAISSLYANVVKVLLHFICIQNNNLAIDFALILPVQFWLCLLLTQHYWFRLLIKGLDSTKVNRIFSNN